MKVSKQARGMFLRRVTLAGTGGKSGANSYSQRALSKPGKLTQRKHGQNVVRKWVVMEGGNKERKRMSIHCEPAQC